jgi:hypothetical protein
MEGLRSAYREHLVQAGVNDHSATQAAAQLSDNELEIISEIWSTWADTWHHHHQGASLDSST